MSIFDLRSTRRFIVSSLLLFFISIWGASLIPWPRFSPDRGPLPRVEVPSITPVVNLPSSPSQELVFLHFGELQPYQIISALHARKVIPSRKAKITILRHDGMEGKNKEAWQYLRDANVRVIDADKNIPTIERFAGNYHHSSINSFNMVTIWMTRFLSLQHYVNAHNIDSFLMLDMDIVLFADIFNFLSPNMTFFHYTSYATHWTQHSLNSFCGYILHFYNRELNDVIKHIKIFGETNPKLQVHLNQSQLIGAWWPVDALRYEFSDMHLFISFLKERPGVLRVKCQEKKCADDVLNIFNSLQGTPGVKCKNISSILNKFKWKFLPRTKLYSPHNRETGHLIPGLHFQGGDCKDIMPDLFCEQLEFQKCPRRFFLW